jgi:hypothetical protein
VVLDRDIVFAGVAHLGCSQCRLGRAARRWRGEYSLRWRCRGFHCDGRITLAVDVGHVRLLRVFHADQRRREARDLRLFGDDQCDRLAAELDLIVVKRPER